MATQQQIEQLNRLIQRAARQYARGLQPRFTEVFDAIAQMPEPTRLQVTQLFQSLRTYTSEQLAVLDQIAQQNLALNEAALDSTDTAAVNTLRLAQETQAALEQQLAAEQESITNAVMLAAIAGALTPAVLRELRRNATRAVRRLELAFEQNTRKFESALTLVRGRAAAREVKYRYSGPVDSESREFCASMAGRELTEAEIRRIWSTQTWSGKSPGDPFVVRGGYNCRHSWTVAENDETDN